MRLATIGFASMVFGPLLIPAAAPAQGIGVIPDGVYLDATPAVSADRRYVRLTVNPMFSTVNGFQTFPVPAAVSGGGAVGFGAGQGGFGAAAGGLFGPGAGGGAIGPVDYSAGVSPFAASYLRFIDTPDPSESAPRPKAARGKKPTRGLRARK